MKFKRLLAIFMALILSASYGYCMINDIELDNDQSKLEVLLSHGSGLSLFYQFDRLNYFTVDTEEGEFTEIYINSLAHTNVVGEPKLPMSRRFIEVPLGAEVSTIVLNYRFDDHSLVNYGIEYPIMPGQHPIPKSSDAEMPPFEYDLKAYSRASLEDEYPLVRAEEVGIMRGVRLFAIELYPVKYNPVEGLLRIYNNIEVEINFTGGDFVATEELRQRTYSPYFEFLYEEQLLNYEPVAERQNLTRYPVKYIIIADPMFETALEPFIDWKIKKGFETIVGYTGTPEVGSTTTSIANYIESIWNSATPDDPAPSFVLFVGDVAQIPAFSGNTGSHISDLHYVRLEGTDYLPEMFYGRFSANNLTELQPQIDKTLTYEKLLMPDPSFLAESVLIAGVDSYWSTSHANGQINYGTEHYFNASNGIIAHTYLYPASGSSSAAIINDVSNGVGYVNYTAHGSPTSWADPSFTINDINNLQNAGQYPMVVGNCCITNQFNTYTCFGEAWLRADNKGAIGYIGGTDNTYWNEDFWWGVGHIANIPSHGNALPYEQTGPGMYDGLFHTHGEEFINWYTTGGAMIYAGNMAVEQSNSTRKNYYWEIYSIMGDPSLTPYMREPLENVATYPQQIFLGQSQIQISAQPYSYVGLSMDGEIYGAALIDESGMATMEIDPFMSPGIANIVITLQDHEPIIEEIQVIPNEGPYVIMEDYEIEIEGSTSTVPQYGDIVNLHITLENVGIEEATDVSVQLSTEDTYITIVDDFEQVGNIPPETSQTIMNAFQLTIADDIPDQHQVFFTLTATGDGDEEWQTLFNFVISAPSMEIEYPIVDDSLPGGDDNGVMDPGETVLLVFPISNNGHAESPETTIRFTNNSPFLTLLSDEYINAGSIEEGETIMAEYTVEVDPDVPEGSNVTVGINVFADSYSVQESITMPIGLIIEDFEDGNFESFPWTFTGNANWVIDSSQSYSGNYSARSGSISHNQSSSMVVSMDIPVSGEISFFLKVSSEANYDFLRFYINNQLQDEWAGEVNWTEVSYPVQSGNNTFRWTYIKDYSVSGGSDCAWVDYIVFPASGITTSGPIFSVYPEEIDFGEVPLGHIVTNEFVITNFGDEDLSGVISTYEGFTLLDAGMRRNQEHSFVENNSQPDKSIVSDRVRTGSLSTAVRQNRDDYNYAIPRESNQTFVLQFQPEVAQDYSGQIMITSNDPENEIAYIDVTAVAAACMFPPTNLEASVQGGSIFLVWEEPDMEEIRYNSNENGIIESRNREERNLLGYNVYRDDVMINTETVTETDYEDIVTEIGFYSYYVTALYEVGESEASNIVEVEVTVSVDDLTSPFVNELRQNYPNPFNPETTIEFSLETRQRVKINIYNITGQQVKTIVDDVLDAGEHRIVWNSVGSNNKKLPSGIYLYRMTTDKYNDTRKMILLK